jgi:hypothetical protein
MTNQVAFTSFETLYPGLHVQFRSRPTREQLTFGRPSHPGATHGSVTGGDEKKFKNISKNRKLSFEKIEITKNPNFSKEIILLPWQPLKVTFPTMVTLFISETKPGRHVQILFGDPSSPTGCLQMALSPHL